MESYKLLESTPQDSLKTIKTNYHKLLRKYHPDKNPETAEYSKKIINAYEWIQQNHNKKFTELPESYTEDPFFDATTPKRDLIPKGFKMRGFTRIPTVHEFVMHELAKPKLQDDSNSIYSLVYSLFR